MIFIANVLSMNGGTTFLIRVCCELQRRGIPVAVLVLFPIYDTKLRAELGRYAKVIDLKNFLWDKGKCFRLQLMTFAPVRWSKLFAELYSYGNTVHVMGVFGLLFALRAVHYNKEWRVTTGVYHQNEFLFNAKDSFFIRTLRQCFTSLSEGQVLFFNEFNVINYSNFFGQDFSSCIVAPIGIDIPKDTLKYSWEPEAGRLVSVGNLVNFKTYNEHIVGVVANLAAKYTELRYDIYGAGPEEQALRRLADRLGVKDLVRFNGPIPYSEFADKVRSAALFIGSGTALIEAAALGVPAMVGVESIAEPETYGFLSEIKGFSYNEFMAHVPRVGMCELVDRLLSDSAYAATISDACKQKAQTFSVISTVDALEALMKNSKVPSVTLSVIQTIRLCFSFACIAVSERFGLSSGFQNRRDQSFEYR